MIEILKALLIWIILLPTAFGMGHFIAAKRLHVENALMRGIYFFALGLGLLGYFIILVGTLGILKIYIVWPAILVFFLLSYRTYGECAQWVHGLMRYLFLQPASGFGNGIRLIFLLSIGVTLISSLVPEIANDSLAYHLMLPKYFISKASILPLPYDEKSWRSLFMEELFTIPMFFKNIPATIFFHWLTTFLLISAMVIWIEEETRHFTLALFAGVLLWLTPTIFNQVAISYSDGSVAFFAFLGFYLIQKAWQKQKDLSDFMFGGILLGLSVSAKYLTLMLGAAVGAASLYVFCQNKSRRLYLFQGMCLLAAGGLTTASYWFIRNYILTGDLLYPLITHKFGTTGLYADQNFSALGVPKNVFNFFALPYFTARFPDLFNRHHWVGPAYFFVFPISILSIRLDKMRPVLITAIISTVLWFLSAQDIRFLLSSFPLWLGLASFALNSYMPTAADIFKKIFKLVGLLTLCGYLSLGIYHYRAQAAAVLNGTPAETFLTDMERSYPAARWANLNLPPHAKVLNAMEVRTYYFDMEMIDASMFYRIHHEFKGAPPAATISLLRKQGITHVMRCAWIRNRKGNENRVFEFLDEALKNKLVFKKLATMDSQNTREDRYRYTFYEII